jgi:hypothetical protein
MPTHPTRPQVAGALLLRWATGPGGSTQQLQQALEFRQQSSSLRRIARLASGTNQHPGQGDAAPGAEPTADPRPKPPVHERNQWEQPGDYTISTSTSRTGSIVMATGSPVIERLAF